MPEARRLNHLTVVSPFFNEALGARAFYEALVRTLANQSYTFDMVFVDDGSSDETLTILNAIADQDSRVTILALSRNFGHQIALTAGIDYAFGDVVVTMDSDLQHPPAVILEMIERYEAGFDIVYAVRQSNENVGYLKAKASDTYYWLLKNLSNTTVVRGAADFRLTSQMVVRSLRRMREFHRYLRGMIPWAGFHSTEISFKQQDRLHGKPSYTWRKSFRLARHGLFSFSTIPLELISWLGIGMTVMALVYLVYILIVAATVRTVEGWASTIIVALVIGGVQLISLGIIAQYIGMIFEEVKGRPLYFLKQERLSEHNAAQTHPSDHLNRGMNDKST
ncbi:MAG: glycosyltransferase family 2 protein [Anaerolineae bacterium]|jgi:dolichol-phosphate mannosyltransferase|nr:glycosyltransferase family 2 protein [Anaerolineae bacterium]